MTKKLEDLTADEFKELKIQFAPGCFDNFDGTQEEVDELVTHIKEMFQNGEFQKNARPLDLDDLDEEDLELLERLDQQEKNAKGRTLQ